MSDSKRRGKLGQLDDVEWKSYPLGDYYNNDVVFIAEDLSHCIGLNRRYANLLSLEAIVFTWIGEKGKS